MTVSISGRRRREVVDALRRGTVPQQGLDVLAVGLDRFVTAIDAELDVVAGGGSAFKAVRGEYGSGKTFFARWLAERAKQRGMAAAEVQVSETETPLHRLETVYRRVAESLTTSEIPPSALRPVLDAWMYTLEEDVLAAGAVDEADTPGLDAPSARCWRSGSRRSAVRPRPSPPRCAGSGRRRPRGTYASPTASSPGSAASRTSRPAYGARPA